MLNTVTETRTATLIRSSIGVLLFLSSCALAQSPAARTGAGGSGPYELSGTYTHLVADGTFGAPLGMNGWTAGVAGRVFPTLQLTGEIGSYHKRGATIYSFLTGPQLKARVWRIQPFVRGLFGLSRASGSNEFSVAAGGGIDVPLA